MKRWIFAEEHDAFRAGLRRWLREEVVPRYADFEEQGQVGRGVWKSAGDLGFLGTDVPEEYGGGGVADWRFNAIAVEEIWYQNVPGFALPLHNDIVMPYILRLGTTQQKERWLPAMVAGDMIGAIAMTEPGTGSDLAAVRTTAVRHGDHYVVNGTKTFISNGVLADLVILVARTGSTGTRDDISLLVVERDMPGFERGRRLKKIGMHAQDTSELFFQDVQVPAANLLGEEGAGFRYLVAELAQERLVVAVGGIAGARTVLDDTMRYARERHVFGQPVSAFQVNRFTFAELHSQVQIGQVFIDRCIALHAHHELSASDAAIAKLWATDLQFKVVDDCLQMHGGYGYVEDYPIARSFRDARVQRIYAGTNEVMKEIIARSLDLGPAR
jgi:long-chain-acyl-CoA dehydrogenase